MRLDAILNEQTGLITVPDFGGGQGIQLQGMDAEHTLIMIDGVPLVGRSAGTLDLSRIAVGNIRQIEIVKGASSSLYGSEALGGVINIITKKPENGYQGNANYRYGTFNSHDTGVNLSYKKNRFGVTAFANRFSSTGYDLVDTDETQTVTPFSNYTFSAKLGYSFSEKTKFTVSGRYYFQDQDNVASAILTGESRIDEWNVQARLQHQFNEKWSSHLEVYTTRYKAEEYLNDETGAAFSSSYFNQLLALPELRTIYTINPKHSLIFGTGWRHESLDRTDFFGTPEFNSQYGYIQYDGNPAEKLNLIIGARFDHHSEYKSQFSPKLAVRYNISEKTTVKAAIGYGFKAPDFRQLYFDFTNATAGYTVLGYNAVPVRLPELENEGLLTNIIVPVNSFENRLNPENSVSVNLGIHYRPTTAISFDINFFRNTIRDLIDTRIVANKTNGQNVFSDYNVDNVYTQGLEYNMKWRLSQNLNINAGYQLLYARDKTAQSAFKNGEVFAKDPETLLTFSLKKRDYFGLYNRSRHMANLKLFYSIPKWKANTNIRTIYRSKYGLTDSNNNGYLDNYDSFVDAYFMVNWAVGKTFYEHYKLSFGIDNLMDFTDAQNIGSIPGRLFYGKLNINF